MSYPVLPIRPVVSRPPAVTASTDRRDRESDGGVRFALWPVASLGGSVECMVYWRYGVCLPEIRRFQYKIVHRELIACYYHFFFCDDKSRAHTKHNRRTTNDDRTTNTMHDNHLERSNVTITRGDSGVRPNVEQHNTLTHIYKSVSNRFCTN